jgi:hypothetical protein
VTAVALELREPRTEHSISEVGCVSFGDMLFQRKRTVGNADVGSVAKFQSAELVG